MTSLRKESDDFEVSGKHPQEESLLYGREKDHSKGTDASLGWVSPAEGIGLY